MFWIPLIGPILQGLFNAATSIYSKFKDTQIAQIQADADAAHVGEQIIKDTEDDIGVRLLRDLALVPPVVWGALVGWDTIVAKRYPDLMFHTANYPEAVQYIPYGAYAFLFGYLGFKIWKGK